MKPFKNAAISPGTPVVIFVGVALMLTSCRSSPGLVDKAPSPSVAPEVVKPTAKVETQPSPVDVPAQTPPSEAAQPALSKETTTTSAPDTSGFVAGTCKELRAQGLSDFSPGDPNYTESRDRDNDGVACES